MQKRCLQENCLSDVVELLSKESMVLRSLDRVNLSLLNSRKKIELFFGLTEKRYYASIFLVKQKSRFLRKNALEIVELNSRLERLKGSTCRVKIVFISSDICSKAQMFLKEHGWKVLEAGV